MHGIVLVAGAKEVRVALLARELAGAGVGRQKRHLGTKQRGANGQDHVGADGAGEEIHLVALDKAVHQLARGFGVARHVGLNKFRRYAAQFVIQQLGSQVQAVFDFCAGASEGAGDVKGHAHFDGLGSRCCGQGSGKSGHSSGT